MRTTQLFEWKQTGQPSIAEEDSNAEYMNRIRIFARRRSTITLMWLWWYKYQRFTFMLSIYTWLNRSLYLHIYASLRYMSKVISKHNFVYGEQKEILVQGWFYTWKISLRFENGKKDVWFDFIFILIFRCIRITLSKYIMDRILHIQLCNDTHITYRFWTAPFWARLWILYLFSFLYINV